MKKGFTMIELIFVIVILGILASVAIPRLAATREDAEISAAVANIRTLVSDATAYYTTKGEIPANMKWNEITNVPLTAKDATKGVTTTDGQLRVGGQADCIIFRIGGKNTNSTGKNANAPAHIIIAKQKTTDTVCQQVQNSEPLKPYFSSKVTGATINTNGGIVAIGSSISIYDEETTTPKPTT
ncbi:MAG: type II secretion system protein [Campylobacter sp.]|nr:type II secretion system protein [Campylobacter sp.]